VTGGLGLTALLGVLAALGGAGSAQAQECPTQSFLLYDHLVYASELLPGAPIAAGAQLGSGELDRPTSENGCERERTDVAVLRAGDIDPAVAVTVEAAADLVFVLGGRCAGYEGDPLRTCLLEPLELGGRSYTGSRYPPMGGALSLTSELGPAEIAGAEVTAVRIEGVDPLVAVAVRGRPDEAFLAPGVCPYERFAAAEEADELRRCLAAPLWFSFDPLGARAGETAVARGDRLAPAAIDGATLALVRIDSPDEPLPDELSGAVPIGAVDLDQGEPATVRFVAPDVAQGVYLAVLECERCASTFGGRTAFPAGSLVLFERSGSSGPRVLVYVLGAAFAIALIASVVMWRKGWRPRRKRRA
jgi:hypothetical protein